MMSNKMIQIRFPNGREQEYIKGTTLEVIAESISPGLKKKAIAGKVNQQLFDLRRGIQEDAEIEILTLESKEGLDVMRHSAAHILAQAVERIHGHINLGVGPVIENGFYYDMDLPNSIAVEELVRIEQEMQNIIDENLEIQRIEVSRDEAKKIFEELGDHLKLDKCFRSILAR